jgi:hypothetical protein
MARTIQQQVPLPLVDDITVKDTVADTCVGVSVVAGSVHMTFASLTANHTINPAPLQRIVSSRLVMPIPSMVGLRDLLNQLIDALTTQGVITQTPTTPTIITPPGRPN